MTEHLPPGAAAPISPWALSRGKRLLDLFGALSGLLLSSPIFLAVALLILLGDRGPVFFRQRRVGRQGVPFDILKFRTMVVNAEQLGAQITVGADPRVTRVGRWLRQTKLDELPQFLNVLRGEMSLVGPRPEVPRYVALYTPAQQRVLALTPGITDPASIRYRDESAVLAAHPDPDRLYVEEIMPAKIGLNLTYAGASSCWSDLAVIGRTLGRILR